MALVTALEDVASVTLRENMTSVTPLENMTSATPLENMTSVTPLENMTSATPLENMTSVTPLENMTSVTPLENMTSVTPIDNMTLGLLDDIDPIDSTLYTTDSTGMGLILPHIAKVVIIIGLLANLLTIAIMATKDSRKVPISRLLLALAICDSVCLCCNSLNSENIASFISQYIISWGGCKVYFWFRLTFAMMSHWLLVVISVERLIAVCLPLRARQMNTDGKAYISLATILAIAGGYVTVWIMQWQGLRGGACIFANIQGAKPVLYVIYGVAYVILPIPVLMVTNSVTAVTLCRKPLGQIKHRNLTLMLLSTTALFILLVSPGVIVFSPQYSASPQTKAITQFLTNVNYASNFFVYVLVGKRFRRNMRALFCRPNVVAPQTATRSKPTPRMANTTTSSDPVPISSKRNFLEVPPSRGPRINSASHKQRP